MKELNINGQVYAKYEIEGSRLYLKMIIQTTSGKGNEAETEDLIINIIQLVENTKFNTVGYLNV